MKKMVAVVVFFLLSLGAFCVEAVSLYDAWDKFVESAWQAENGGDYVIRGEYEEALGDFVVYLEAFVKTDLAKYVNSQGSDSPKADDDSSRQDSLEEKPSSMKNLYNMEKKLCDKAKEVRQQFSDGRISAEQSFVELQNLVLAVARCETEVAKDIDEMYALLVIIISAAVTGIGAAVIIYARRQKIVSELKQNMEDGKTIVRIQENERSRMYRELHDTVAQDIRATALFSKQLENQNGLSHDVAELTNKITHLCQKSLNGIYATISGLAPPELDGNFSDALEMLCTNHRRLTGIPCKRHIDKDAAEMLSSLDTDKKLHIYRIVQEALQNAAKHARPSECSLIVNATDAKISLFVTDDGTGFLQDGAGAHSRRTFGISGMKSRAELVGAQLSIDSGEESGTEVKLEIPLYLVQGGGIKRKVNENDKK